MGYRNGNYCAFYVDEPFNQNNLGASSTPDFVTYNLLRAWKGEDSSFPFIDSKLLCLVYCHYTKHNSLCQSGYAK